MFATAAEMAHLQKKQADSAAEAEQAAQEVARLQKQQAISASEAEQAAQEVARLQKRCNDLEKLVKVCAQLLLASTQMKASHSCHM